MQFSTPAELEEGRGVGRVKAMMLESRVVIKVGTIN